MPKEKLCYYGNNGIVTMVTKVTKATIAWYRGLLRRDIAIVVREGYIERLGLFGTPMAHNLEK